MSTTKGGLEGVVAGTSSISEVDGMEGRLSYRGYSIADLATHSSFEETAYLLWYGRLPYLSELSDLEDRLSAARDIPSGLMRTLHGFPESSEPMETLRTAVSALSMYDPGGIEHHHDVDLSRAILLAARIPVIVAAHHRIRQKLEPVAHRHDLSLAGNFLYMLNGRLPSERAGKILDTCLILHADHELNASTFAARVAAATLSDIYSSITAAIGTLAGPLHGGANQKVMEMLERVGDASKAEQFVQGMLAEKKKVPGFGHRVYRTEDPRATVLRRLSGEMAEESGNSRWYEISRRIEATMMRETGIDANVDFYSASVYYTLDIPMDLFTPIFAISRVVGWAAHVLEQYDNNRLIRPRAEYVGLRGLTYVPLEVRGDAVEA